MIDILLWATAWGLVGFVLAVYYTTGRRGRRVCYQASPDWMEEARRYAQNAEYWRLRAERAEARVGVEDPPHQEEAQ